jgi:periplasmic protein TonB
MSLTPLLLARLSAAPAAQPATTAGRYDPGAGHRPVAAVIAVSLPAALMVAVALSPFKLPLLVEPAKRTPIETIAYIPPPEPDTQPRDRVERIPTVPPRPLPPIPDAPQRPADTADPVDPGPIDRAASNAGAGNGTGTGTTTVESIPVLPLIVARPDPRFASSFQPDYPAREQREEIEGAVQVRVLVGTDGRVKAVEEIASSSPGFFAETRRRALAKWRFRPATRGGTAEESWVVMTVRFQLEG